MAETILPDIHDADDEGLLPSSFSIPLEVDKYDTCMLGEHNEPHENDQPREVIAEHVKNWRLRGELKRPLLFGTYEGEPAYILVFKFTFQRLKTSSFLRIRNAIIEIRLEDAPSEPVLTRSLARPPQIGAIYPKLYEGPTSHTTIQHCTSLTMGVSGGLQGMAIQGGVSRKTIRPKEGKVRIHGQICGGRLSNCVEWSITENEILKDGVPREFELALVTKYTEGRRFCATVAVWAGFAWNIFDSKMQVMGKHDDPLFFNPTVLNKFRSNSVVARNMGRLDDVDLDSYVSVQL